MNHSRRQMWAETKTDALPKADQEIMKFGFGKSTLPVPDRLWLLLNRGGFGIRQEQWERAQSLGFDAWLEEQLNHSAINDNGLEAQLQTLLPTLSMSNAQIISYSQQLDRQNVAVDELRAATLTRQVYSPRQLYEVMVEFWTDHFNIQHIDGPNRYYKTTDDRDVIRLHALGKFPDMLRASAHSPAMLYYLDNYSNVVTGPNENYARELLELHTIGLGGGFTEADVREVARAFTGWTFGQRGGAAQGEFGFTTSAHDFNSKRIFGVDFAAGQGLEDGDQVLDLLASNFNTAKFIATKLCKRFISDAPPISAIDAVAATYVLTGGDIKAMLRTLFKSNEFSASGDQKLKRPTEYFAGVLRVTGVTTTNNWLRILATELNNAGHLPFMWATPDGYPDIQGYWSNSSGLIARWNFAIGITENTLGNSFAFDPQSFVGGVATPESIVDTLVGRVLRRPISTEDRNMLIGFVSNGALSYRPLPPSLLLTRVRETVSLMLSSPYFQYR